MKCLGACARMTEYVNSPGILERYPGTKITYNLVPSLMEQLLDYHREETLDVHTDIAKRPWPEGDYQTQQKENYVMQFQSFWNSLDLQSVQIPECVGTTIIRCTLTFTIRRCTTQSLQRLWTMIYFHHNEFLDLQVCGIYTNFHLTTSFASTMLLTDDGLIALFQQKRKLLQDDLMYVVTHNMSTWACSADVSDLAATGQVELTTTPYYHPILPLLMMPGWQMEDGIRVTKQPWPDDVQNHLTTGMDLFEEEMGFRPVGMWPSEEAVSPNGPTGYRCGNRVDGYR